MLHHYKMILAIAMLLLIPAITGCNIWSDIQEGKLPRYEVGEHMGAVSCGVCHQEIYQKWSQNSRHAVATTAESFHAFKDKFTDNFWLDAMMGEEMCYACHGSKQVNEGVNCETCHGIATLDVNIMDQHRTKYTPGRAKMKEPEFCSKCHTMISPMTGDHIMSLYQEWQNSAAATSGLTCQECHMKPRDSKFRYHGFDTVRNNVEMYRDKLRLFQFELDFPRFNLTIANNVQGHAIPASGPSRSLVLEISFQDAEGEVIHESFEIFAKKYATMPLIGLMPYKEIDNTQLQAGEVRELSFSLPSELEGRIKKARLVLKFYDVSDEHEGDIEQAHWISDPVIEKEVSL